MERKLGSSRRRQLAQPILLKTFDILIKFPLLYYLLLVLSLFCDGTFNLGIKFDNYQKRKSFL